MCMNLNVYQLRTSQYSYESIYMEPSSVHPLISVLLFVIPWTTACQASLSVTNSRSLLKLMSIESVMPSNHLILCLLLLLLPSIFPSIRVFSKKSVLHISNKKSKTHNRYKHTHTYTHTHTHY